MKNRYILLLILLLAGCAVKQPQIGEKAIPDEDNYIIKALIDEDSGRYKEALFLYKFLYKNTNKDIYYKKYISVLYAMKKYDELISKANKFLKKKWNDKIFEYEIFALIREKKFEKAKETLLNKFNKKNEFFYSTMSYILIKQHHFDQSIFYLKSNYALNPTKTNLLNLTDNLIKIKRYNEALAYLQTHFRLYGCDYDVCLRLAEIYKELYDVENLADIYERMGQFDHKYYILALNLYMDNGRYKKAIKLVEKYNLDKEYLMYIYEQKGDYKSAALVALNLYLKTKNIDYLLKYTIYIYKVSQDKETLNEVVDNLKYILSKKQNPFLYNFLGYILINKNINPKEGIEYVKKALEYAPSNMEYTDSLAWGYYKLHKCKMAWDIIKKINIDDKTINFHKKTIKRCLYDFGKNNKTDKKRFGKKKKQK